MHNFDVTVPLILAAALLATGAARGDSHDRRAAGQAVEAGYGYNATAAGETGEAVRDTSELRRRLIQKIRASRRARQREAGSGTTAGTPKAPSGTENSFDAPEPALERYENEMGAWMKYAFPGPEHRVFQRLAGHWKAEARFWMAPGADPMLSEGTSESNLILGGRFLEDRYESSFGGRPFSGRGLTGYHRYAGVFENIWVDTMGTLTMVSRGTMNKDGTELTMRGSFSNPSDGKKKRYKMVTRIVSDDLHVFEMWDTTGTPQKTMEITYTRIPDPAVPDGETADSSR